MTPPEKRSCVLDASALLALLQGEPGGEKVEEFLETAAISSVNWSEVMQKALDWQTEIEGLRQELEVLGLEILPLPQSLPKRRPSPCLHPTGAFWAIGLSALASTLRWPQSQEIPRPSHLLARLAAGRAERKRPARSSASPAESSLLFASSLGPPLCDHLVRQTDSSRDMRETPAQPLQHGVSLSSRSRWSSTMATRTSPGAIPSWRGSPRGSRGGLGGRRQPWSRRRTLSSLSYNATK